jgi:hypothetical protein
MSGAAFAQDDLKTDAYVADTQDAYVADIDMVPATAQKTDAYVADTQMVPATAQIMLPGNTDPEHDARGIAVISDAAYVPAGFNLTANTVAVGGPFVDASTATQPADEPYPACTAIVTDNCVQTYERN